MELLIAFPERGDRAQFLIRGKFKSSKSGQAYKQI